MTSPDFLNGLLSFPEVSKGKPLKIKEVGWGVSAAGGDRDVTFMQLGSMPTQAYEWISNFKWKCIHIPIDFFLFKTCKRPGVVSRW